MTKKKNAPGGTSGRVIGRERKIVHRALTDEDRQTRRAAVGRTYQDQREIQDEFQAFDRWASPRVRRTLDPDYKNESLKGEAELTIEQARSLAALVAKRRKLAGAAVATLKAERALALDEAVFGFSYDVADCDIVADDDALEVLFVDRRTGEEVDRRAMTDGERQTSLAGVGEATSSSGAPATAH